MKATIDFDDRLYRRLKVEAARRGRTIRDLVHEGVRLVPELSRRGGTELRSPDDAEWFGSLREYAPKAGGEHDLGALRRSVARRRGRRT